MNMITSKPNLNTKNLYSFLTCEKATARLPRTYSSIDWFSSGAKGLAKLCERTILEKERAITIALPGYFCGQSIRFLRSMSVNIVFYSLTESLTPNFAELEKKLEDTRLDLFVLVHYFGAIKAQAESRVFADNQGAIFLEDCAHVTSYRGSDWIGDYLLFCPHKHFALPSVGLLIHRNQSFYNPIFRKDHRYLTLIWMVKQLFRSYIKRSVAPWRTVWSNILEHIDERVPDELVIRNAVREIENCDQIVSKRKINAKFLRSKLDLCDGWRQFNEIENDATPYLLAMICDDEDIAKRRYQLLNMKHQLVMQWPDLPAEILEDKSIYNQAEGWLGRVLFFFIHQQMDTSIWISEVESFITSKGF
jgi:hypothetical protein